MTDKKITSWKAVIGSIVGLFTIIGGMLVVNEYIEKKIQQFTTTAHFLDQVATRVRPSIIFDSRGTILSDMGGMQLIETIEVLPKKPSIIPEKVILVPKKFLSQTPILTSIDPVQAEIIPQRGKGLSFEYQFGGAVIVGGNLKVTRYRLEFIPN